MNRPKYPRGSKDLSFEEFMCAESNYFRDIEKYCDELELKNLKLEKALDKALEIMTSGFGCDECKVCYAIEHNFGCTDKEDWKEYLLNE